jgi:5-methylcytosine-specific restriction endonuclease McrBC GTP-binding regulatory subunit McrB
MNQITKEHILQAIQEIDREGIRNGRHSSTYDVVYNGKKYPPKLIISIANRFATGVELDPKEFHGGKDQPAFKLLKSFGFLIEPKRDNFTELIEKYKAHIKATKLKDELYKWDLLDTFKGRPDLNAENFLAEVKSVNYSNLLFKHAKAVIYHLANKKPNELKGLFKSLFDENVLINDRVKSFNEGTLELYRSIGENLQHHQDERTIGAYLTFYNPDKYTFYKFSFYKKLCELLSIKLANKNEKFGHYLDLVNGFIRDYIEEDQELIDLVKSFVPLYDGTNHLLLAQDILYQMLDKSESINYWLYSPGENASKWDEFYEEGIMGLGWDDLGDLDNYKTKKDIQIRLQEIEKVESTKQNDTAANYEFHKVIKEGDIIIVKKGVGELLGYGEVISDYFYDETRDSYQKCREVDWKLKGNWKVDHSIVAKTLTDITKYKSEEPNYSKYYERLLAIMEGKSFNSNYKQGYSNYLTTIYDENSGTKTSYIKAIEILSKLLSYNVFEVNDLLQLQQLYADLIKEQRNTEGKYFHPEAPSYGQNGFYSASIKTYIDFHKQLKDNSMNSSTYKAPLNQILYGPPGTGKTYNTVLEAAKIVTGNETISYDEALKVFNDNLNNQIEFITFHQNYSYEDFIQGLRPDTENGSNLTFDKKDGVFKRIADRALENYKASENAIVSKISFGIVFNEFIQPFVDGELNEIAIQMKKTSYFITDISNKTIFFRKSSGGTDHTLSIATLEKMYNNENIGTIQGLSSYYEPLLQLLLEKGKSSIIEKVEKKNYVIIIDEINRANISRVFGELITLIEEDKRSHGKIPMRVTLPSGDSFTVPSNLFIIGTMNTADKSISLLDIALRRRFEFVPMYPNILIQGVNSPTVLETINAEIIKRKGHDFTIGHAYFMGEEYTLEKTINNKVIPLLLEYFMNDEKEVAAILKAAEIEVIGWPMKMKTA